MASKMAAKATCMKRHRKKKDSQVASGDFVGFGGHKPICRSTCQFKKIFMIYFSIDVNINVLYVGYGYVCNKVLKK